MNNVYHYSLIKIIVLHHLSLLNFPWETFIAHDMFRGPHISPSMVQEIGGPSTHVKTREEQKEMINVEVPIFLTYKRGTRKLFAVSR